MNNRLEISLLGRVEIKQAGQPLAGLTTRKAEALLIYLACTGRPHPRDLLAELLWPERSQGQARHNLRTDLARLRQTLAAYIVSVRQQLAFNQAEPYWLDVAELQQRLAAGRQAALLSQVQAAALAEALDLYRGDFLAGFHLPDAPDFETWVTLERERLHRQTLEGIHQLVSCYLSAGEYPAGLAWGRRLLALDEFDEVAHSQMMRLLALNGQRGAALAQYETCCRILVEALGVEPSGETLALYEQIRAGRLDQEVAQPGPSDVIAALPGLLRPDPYLTLSRLGPLPDQRLFGVEPTQAKLETVIQRQDATWLIAIDGIGGIGKTALAQTLIHNLVQTERFYDIGWVSAKQEEFLPGTGLQTTGNPTLTEATLTDILLEQLADRPYLSASLQERQLALTRLLKEQPHLVVIDNLETVLDYQALLPYLRQLANPSKFLLTSRHSLKTEPDVYSLSLIELSQPDAVALLHHQAEVRGITTLSDASPAQLDRIYGVVGGNPLALKLVAGQVSFLPLTQVLDSLTQAQGKSVEALYTYIYWQAWQMMTVASRQLLLTLPLSPNSTFTDLVEISPLAGAELPQALRQLIDLSLVEVGGDLEEPYYRLHRLTETFLLHEVLKWQATAEAH